MRYFNATIATLCFASCLCWTPVASGQSRPIAASEKETFQHPVKCEGVYPAHLQGICVDQNAIYWSFTTRMVKTDRRGIRLTEIPVANHHGDLCIHDDNLYVAVNLGEFNDPKGNADSWIYVYSADDLSLVAKHEVQEAFHGAGGIGYRDGRFFVVGGLPSGFDENFVYEYDRDFNFIQNHSIPSGQTLLGIQTATFANGQWWFGCYGRPAELLVTDADFKMIGRYEFNCSLGIAGLPDGTFLAAVGRCSKESGCSGAVRFAMANSKTGLHYID